MNFDKFKVIDNFIPKFYQEELKSMVTSPTFPWYYIRDITYGSYSKNMDTNPGLAHAYRENGVDSLYFKVVENIGLEGIKQAESSFTRILQARSFFQLPLAKTFKKHETDYLHVDIYQPHLVVLYYVFDAEGDTILTDHVYKENDVCKHDLMVEDYNVIARITPKQGRAVLFDGKYYHTAQQPTENIRCVINLDIVK
jgi:hypothetical protein